MKVFFLLLCLPVLVFAQETGLDRLAQRQAAFGRTIPQEKVFIHMDNTSYQLGDTIWFTAYTRRTDTGRPSDVSGVLYVELFGQEGYMTERKLIRMSEGRGHGFFALNKHFQYAGFYELRAYTRWQLNWGRFEHEHTRKFGEQFPSRQKEQEFCRDYEKLYSRVFPVYDKPVEPGDFSHDMTLRAMRRVYKKDPGKRELHLSLYPEGGALVEGLPCRIAFEAAWDDGEWADGWLHFGGDSARTLNRGRGLFEVVPHTGQEQEVLFVSKDGKTAKARLPKAEQTGVSLRVEQTDSGWVARVRHSADLSADSLGVSLMQEGRAVKSEELRVKNEELRVKNKGNNSGGDSNSDSSLFVLHSSLSSPGIYQLTVFDTRGRVFADRLFFHRGKETLEPTLSIEGLKDEYQPYEAVSLKVKAWPPSGSLSLSVRDDLNRDFLYDDGNILTEMLLSSEIRGFVPHPGWYFEGDDSLHRAALDLLMMTQGWRRFDWQSMALPGAWDITEPAEKSPILTGSTQRNVSLDGIEFGDSNQGRASRDKNGYLRALNQREQEKNSRELKVHAELVVLDADTTFTGESRALFASSRLRSTGSPSSSSP